MPLDTQDNPAGFFSIGVPLPIPLNQRYSGSSRGGLYLRKPARERDQAIVGEIHQSCGGMPEPLQGPVCLKYTLTLGVRNHVWDVDAPAKSLLDCCQKAGIIENDKQVETMIGKRSGAKEKEGHVLLDVFEI